MANQWEKRLTQRIAELERENEAFRQDSKRCYDAMDAEEIEYVANRKRAEQAESTIVALRERAAQLAETFYNDGSFAERFSKEISAAIRNLPLHSESAERLREVVEAANGWDKFPAGDAAIKLSEAVRQLREAEKT